MAQINFSGIASGIDSSALIQSLLDQERAVKIKPLETKIADLTDTNSAFDQLNSLLESLKTKADKFRTLNGGVLAKIGSSSDETKVTAAATNGASNGTYALNVTALAKNHTTSFDDRFSATNSVINSNIVDGAPAADRTVSYTIGSGADQEVVDLVLTSSTTASEFVSSFNASATKASASLVNVGTSAAPSYAIVVNSNNEGTVKGNITVSVGTGITDPNGDLNTSDGALLTSTSSAATNASFTVTGIAGAITRGSNAVSDVIDGVTFNLHTTGAATVRIRDDESATTAALQEFVDAYNEIVSYIKENDLITREEDGDEVKNIFSPLASTSLDENILSSLREAFSNASTSGRTVNTFADLGITTNRDGTLNFDSEVFETALNDDSEGARLITSALGDDLAAVDGRIAQFTRFNGLLDQAQSANNTTISNAQQRIDEFKKALAQQEQALTGRFARLEALIGKLNSQQSSLTSALSGL